MQCQWREKIIAFGIPACRSRWQLFDESTCSWLSKSKPSIGSDSRLGDRRRKREIGRWNCQSHFVTNWAKEAEELLLPSSLSDSIKWNVSKAALGDHQRFWLMKNSFQRAGERKSNCWSRVKIYSSAAELSSSNALEAQKLAINRNKSSFIPLQSIPARKLNK